MTQQPGSSLPTTDATTHGQLPRPSPSASHGCGKSHSRVRGRQFREEWKTTYPWLVAKDGKCFCRLCLWITEGKRWSPTDRFSPRFSVTGFSNWKKSLSGAVKSNVKHSHGSFSKHERSNAHAKALIAFSTSRQGNDAQRCTAKHLRLRRSWKEPP